jgi:hypothetical protein
MALSKNHTREMIEAIKLEREQVANEMDRLEDKLYALEATLATYGVKTLRPRSKKQQPKSEPPSQVSIPIGEEPDYDYKGLTQADAAYRYLVEKGDPAHVDEIVEALLRRGIQLKGDDQQPSQEKRRTTLKQSLVSTLIRDPERFKNIGRNHFTLVYELPPAINDEDALVGFENIEEQEVEPEAEPVEDPMFEREYE